MAKGQYTVSSYISRTSLYTRALQFDLSPEEVLQPRKIETSASSLCLLQMVGERGSRFQGATKLGREMTMKGFRG